MFKVDLLLIGGVKFEELILPARFVDINILAGCAFVLALMSFDWLWLGEVRKAVRLFMGYRISRKINSILGVLVALVVMAGLILGIIWMYENVPTWVKLWVAPIFGAVMGILLLRSTFLTARYCFRDWLRFRKIVVSNRMSRQDIAVALNLLEWPILRLALVRRLSQIKTVATGDWPLDFEISVSGDSAITELAKLEERWLKLDR